MCPCRVCAVLCAEIEDEAAARKQAVVRAAELAVLRIPPLRQQGLEREREEAQQQRKETSERKKKWREEKAKAAL